MLISALLIGITRALVGAAPRWQGSAPSPAQRIYFANHSSHIDTLALWSALPRALRRHTRPVAAADYWNTDAVRRCIAVRGLNAVFIERQRSEATKDPLAPLTEALAAGDSLILFPEGTRNQSDASLQPFKSGLFHLAALHPDFELVPVWIANLNRVMPKGEFVPIPLICTVTFGEPMHLADGEDKDMFLERAREALLALAPKKAAE